jgi:hypothetical protein
MYSHSIAKIIFMQSSNTISVHTALQQKELKATIQQQVNENLATLMAENENLKRQIAQLKEAKKETDGKFSSVRIQLQMLFYLLDLKRLIEKPTLSQIGTFFSALLNRHPQRARKPFSSFYELTYSTNKQVAKGIRKDLLKVQRLFL